MTQFGTNRNSPNSTQYRLLKHHGGDADIAMKKITDGFERRHDEAFWHFWATQLAPVLSQDDLIVDLGAGIGQFVQVCADRYPHAQVVGLEYAPYMLAAQLPMLGNAQVIEDDLNCPRAPIGNSSAALVMANMVVHELVQPVKMFAAAHRWLKPGGRMCVIDVVRQPLADYLQRRYTEMDMWQEHTTRAELEDAFEHFMEHNRYHAADIEYMLETCGFEMVHSESMRNGAQIRMVVEKPIG